MPETKRIYLDLERDLIDRLKYQALQEHMALKTLVERILKLYLEGE